MEIEAGLNVLCSSLQCATLLQCLCNASRPRRGVALGTVQAHLTPASLKTAAAPSRYYKVEEG